MMVQCENRFCSRDVCSLALTREQESWQLQLVTVSYDGDSSDQWRVRHSQPSTEENIQRATSGQSKHDEIYIRKPTMEFLKVLLSLCFIKSAVVHRFSLYSLVSLQCIAVLLCFILSVYILYCSLLWCQVSPWAPVTQWQQWQCHAVSWSRNITPLPSPSLSHLRSERLSWVHTSVRCLLWCILLTLQI